MIIKITPQTLDGTIHVPASKSMTHRELIASALAKGSSTLRNVTMSKDIEATIRILRQFGTVIDVEKGEKETLIHVTGGLKKQEGTIIADAGESGSTLRFLIPIGIYSGNRVQWTGHGRLSERPLTPYYDLFDEKGIAYQAESGGLPLTVEGKWEGGLFELPGNVSSQFFTGILFILPLLAGGSALESTTEVESEGYINMTIDTMRKRNIALTLRRAGHYEVFGPQEYEAADTVVEGDYSQAAFWLAAGLSGGTVKLTGLTRNSRQGDRAILDILIRMNAFLAFEHDDIIAVESQTEGTVIDARDCPDLVPVLAALASVSKGKTEIVNAARVRLKESDRLHAMAVELNKIGAKVEETKDGLIIEGVPALTGGTVSSWNDHRIAMALAAISPRCKDSLIIEGAEAVAKSYPGFWDDFASISRIPPEVIKE